MISLVNHGGLCCGIKHIYGLDYSPNSKSYYEYTPAHKGFPGDDTIGNPTRSDYNLYGLPYNKGDKLGDIFTSMVEYCRKHRPAGVIEVTIILYEDFDDCFGDDVDAVTIDTCVSRGDGQALWVPFLVEKGFKLVTKFVNSNSGNLVGVFHYVYNDME